MCKRTICLASLTFVLGLIFAGASHAAESGLVGCWKFDEGSGTTAYDSSGNGNDGTLVLAGNAISSAWVPGVYYSALSFDGVDDYVQLAEQPPITNGFTFCAWVKRNGDSPATQEVFNNHRFFLRTMPEPENSDNPFETFVNLSDGSVEPRANSGVASTVGQWFFVAATWDKTTLKIYVNGELSGSSTRSGELSSTIVEARIGRGEQTNVNANPFNGLIDEVAFFDVVLEAEAIEAIMNNGLAGIIPGQPFATRPSPDHEATDVLRDADLSWSAGVYAVEHDVYFGTVFEDVNTATVPTVPGLDVNSFDPGRLDFGQTYYWRIDEVNGAPDRTVFKGAVWRFEVEPFSIPVETISVTASSANDDGMGPEKTIDASGLDALDQHSTLATDMWLSASGDQDVWIQYEFDQAYKLDKLLVWNSNQMIESFVGLGVKDVVIETSLDGEIWTALEAVPPFNQAPGAATYTANTTVDFTGAVAQYVKINVASGHGFLGQFGLSEVRFLYIPTNAREPQPANGEATAGVDVALSWRPGHEAASHELYLGTDPADLALATTTDAPTFLAEALDYGQTYYWQVIEINEAETPSAYAGPIWSINTPAHGVVDDFDLYDDNCQRIFFAWEDGLGHNGGEGIEGCDVPPSNGNGGGSIVGNASAPFAEQMIVFAGTQSMPLEYDNAFGASEATLTFPSQDWTASGIKSLSLYVFGATDNTGQLYLKIDNTRVDGASDISQPGWQPWHIDLSTVGGNLTNVTSLTLGIDGANAAGKVYVDSIRLYPQVLQSTGPVLSYVKITNDEDSGISVDNVYTHKLDFGQGTPGALINGVQFDPYNAAANGSLNFNRESSSGAASDHAGNGNHNVSGSLVDLLTDMYYNGNNAPGGTTTWTLSGLIAGQTYVTRIYTRQWGASDSRNVSFVFDPDGAGPISDSTGKVSQDNATSVGLANDNDAYCINYAFTAVEGQDLVITLTQDNSNNSWHLYGLTNQEVTGP